MSQGVAFTSASACQPGTGIPPPSSPCSGYPRCSQSTALRAFSLQIKASGELGSCSWVELPSPTAMVLHQHPQTLPPVEQASCSLREKGLSGILSGSWAHTASPGREFFPGFPQSSLWEAGGAPARKACNREGTPLTHLLPPGASHSPASTHLASSNLSNFCLIFLPTSMASLGGFCIR